MNLGQIRISKNYVLEYLKAIERNMTSIQKNQHLAESDELYYIKFDMRIKTVSKNIAMLLILTILTSSYLVVSHQTFISSLSDNKLE